MGRTSDARERILAASHDLLDRRGYAALGVADICRAARVPKGSFYHFFDSKHALATAVIEERWTTQRRQWTAILAGETTPLERLRDLFEATLAVQEGTRRVTGTVTGCLFGNLALELSTQDEPFRLLLQEIFDAQVTMIAHVIEAAQDQGELQVADAREAARAIVALLEGMVLFTKLLNDPGQLDRMWAHGLTLLGANQLRPE